MLQNEYLIAIVAVHTAENEPSKVCLYLSLFVSILSLFGPYSRAVRRDGSPGVHPASADIRELVSIVGLW